MFLALDLATSLGWAFGGPDMDLPVSGSFRLPKTGANVGRFTLAYGDWLRGHCETHRPETLIYEATFFGPNTERATLLKLYGLQIKTEEIGEMLGLRVVETSIASWRKHFIGRGSAPPGWKGAEARKWCKNAAVEACRERGWVVHGDDEAEACGILDHALSLAYPDYAARTFCLKPQFGRGVA